MYFDWTYIFAIIAALISIFAQTRVHSVYGKYKVVGSKRGITGAQAARQLLESAGISDVTVERVSGNLTDHYDPTVKALRLSKEVHDGKSLSAVGIAAHEAGHAIQHHENYAPLNARMSFVKVANIGSTMSIPIILLGCFFAAMGTATALGSFLMSLGLLMFSAVVALSLVTLPVEFNASGRAIAMLKSQDILSDAELEPVKSVLKAAAWTYIASTISAVLTLLRLIILTRNSKGGK